MARVSTYLNFQGNTREAFDFYRQVFKSDFVGEILPIPGTELIMHIALPITAGHVLMATDFDESQGHQIRYGNNTTIHLELDSVDEARSLYGQLSQESEEFSPVAEMPWGAYWGTCLDRFGIRWMFSAPLA